MKKFTIVLAIFIAIGINAIGQAGWTMVGSGLPADKGVGQISIGMNDNTAMWGLAINNDGSIYDAFTRSTDGGNTWEAGTFNAGTGLSQLFAIDADVCWAVFNTGATQGLYKTEDGGLTWEKKGGVYGASSFANVIHFFNDNDGFAQGDPVGGEYELYTTTDGGETWTPVDGANIPDPTSGEFGITGNYCAVGDNIWWGTNQGRIFRSTDKGYTWEASLTAFGATEVVNALMFDADNGIAYRSYLNMGVEPVLNETSDGGATWTSFNTVGASFARFFYHVPGTVNTVIGSAHDATAGMGISISEDGGHNWTEISVGFPFMASAWLDLETGWCGTLSTGTGTDGMYIYGEGPTLAGPTNLEYTVDYNDVTLTWDEPTTGGEMIELIQHDGNPLNAYYQEYDNGYGVVYDISAYPGATIESVDFRHSSWGVLGTWDYKLHVVDWDTYTEVFVTDVIQTTGDDQWEEGISLGSLAGQSGLVGIFLEPMSNDPADAYPCLDADNVGPDGMSYFGPLSDYSGMTLSGVGDFLMDLWIMTAGDQIVVKPPKVLITSPGPAIARNGSIPLTGTEFTLQQQQSVVSFKDALLSYNIYRDDEVLENITAPASEYTDVDVPIGVHTYYVTAVYDEGESDPSNTVTVDIITSVPEMDAGRMVIYPNPAANRVYVESESDIISVVLYTYLGQVVTTLEPAMNKAVLDVSNREPGIYFVRIETEQGIVTKKITIN